MTRRSRGREVALQVLYQVEQNPGLPADEVRRFIDRRLLGDEKLVAFTEDLVAGVRENQPKIDAMITEVAENWRLDRMAAIDRNILRLGAYEMLLRPEVPAKVAINEALELAKRYSTAQSSRFVNGILDRVLQLHAASQAGERESAAESPAAAGTGEADDIPAADRPSPAAPRPTPPAGFPPLAGGESAESAFSRGVGEGARRADEGPGAQTEGDEPAPPLA